MAKIRTLIEIMKLCREAVITPWIHGHRGLGKSSIVAQYAREGLGKTYKMPALDANGKPTGESINAPLPMGCIDFRLAQCEASDIRGLPDKVDGRTVFLPPADMPIGDLEAEEIEDILQKIPDLEERRVERIKMQNRYKNGVLFLDELNRAGDDVQNAVFQLVLDRRVGTYVLPAGWQIVVAGNYMEGDYQTGGFTDAAFIDRFLHTSFSAGESTMDDWMQWMATNHGGEASKIIEYTSSKVELLDGVCKGDLGFTVSPSRRSWDAVARIEKAAAKLKVSPESVHEAITGLLGTDAATGYRNYSCPVKPTDVLKNGVAPYKKPLAGLTRMQLTGLAWGIISFAKDKVAKDKDTATVCLDLVEFLLENPNIQGRDIPIAFCRALQSGENQGIASAILTNPELARILSKSMKNCFVEELVKRPKLQDLMVEMGWGMAKKK